MSDKNIKLKTKLRIGEKIKNFLKKSFIGGLTVVIPIAAIFAIFGWLWKVTVGFIHPITLIVSDKSGFSILFSEIISLIAIAISCFFIGVFITTTFGKWFHSKFDRIFAKLAPGYKMLKGVFDQLLSSDGNSSFLNGTPVFLFNLGPDSPSSLTGFISGRDEETGIVSVYCPIPMNPSSGIVYHVPESWTIEMKDVTNEDVLRTVIGFGTGSHELIQSTPELKDAYKKLGN